MKTDVQKLLEQHFTCRAYSGRGMMGAGCLGIEVDSWSEVTKALMQASQTLNKDLFEQLMSALDDMKSDQLGYGMIVYFPSIPYSTE